MPRAAAAMDMPSSMPMMRYRRKSKPENLHPRTELSQRFLAKDEDIAWKAARINVPPPVPDNIAPPNAMRDERGRACFCIVLLFLS